MVGVQLALVSHSVWDPLRLVASSFAPPPNGNSLAANAAQQQLLDEPAAHLIIGGGESPLVCVSLLSACRPLTR